MGIFLHGYFIVQEAKQYEDHNRISVVVAVGATTYRVYMSDDFDPGLLADAKVGEEIEISARPYVNKKSQMVWADGELV